MASEKLQFTPIAQMTIKAMGCSPRDAVKQDTTVYLVRIFGEATEIKTKEDRKGEPYSYLVGDFRGVKADKTAYESSKLFLPGSLQEIIEGQLKTSKGQSVKFGFDIYSNPDDSTATGYRYAARPIVKTEASNRLDEMTAEVMNTPVTEVSNKALSTKPETTKGKK